MRRLLASVLWLAAASALFAGDREVRDFQERARSLGESISSETSANSETCADLRRQIEDLQGKPLRRSSAREAYRTECTEAQDSLGFGTAPIGGGY